MKSREDILITSYTNPDLDGFACSFAYAEFLNKSGKPSKAAIFGSPHREAFSVIYKYKIPELTNAEKIIANYNKIIIVDASDPNGLSNRIQLEQVIGIIDHRKNTQANLFPNAKKQIELVGAAATLIAEKYYNSKIDISLESASLLFCAIVSNTINFQASVTTQRDVEMADWLKKQFTLPADFISRMFKDKSEFKKPLKEIFENDFATFNFNNNKIGIVQLEIINVENFVKKNINEINKILATLKKEKLLNYIFLTCIDTEKAFNVLVVIDNRTKDLLKESLNTKFRGNYAKIDKILMRKEIVPPIREILNNSKNV